MQTTEYRYAGTNPSNYVKFNHEMWRIIGLVNVLTDDNTIEQRIKIVRKESIGIYIFDNKSPGEGCSNTNYGCNDWMESKIMKVLNYGPYYNREKGECPRNNHSNIECDFSTSGLTIASKQLIDENIIWNTGGIPYSDQNISIENYYEYERGKNILNNLHTEWIHGRVGLIYPSDYGYATSGGTNFTREKCLKEFDENNTEPSWINMEECYNNDWLQLNM